MTIDWNLELEIKKEYIEHFAGGSDEYGNYEILGGRWEVRGVEFRGHDITHLFNDSELNEIEEIINQ